MKIVVTGGSRGIGKKIIDNLKKGNNIIVISQSAKSIDSIAKQGIKGYVGDVSDFNKIKEIFNNIGPFHALINCAGILGPVGLFSENSMQDWSRTIEVNILGTVNCCKAAIPLLKAHSESSTNAKIINLSGGGAAYPRLYHTAYACSKAGVVRFTEGLAEDLKKDNDLKKGKIQIDVNVIAPGAHKTGLWNEETHDKKPEKWAEPNDVIRLVKFLLSEKSNGITGKFLHIKDGYAGLDSNVSDTDLFTLRRIDDFMFAKISRLRK